MKKIILLLTFFSNIATAQKNTITADKFIIRASAGRPKAKLITNKIYALDRFYLGADTSDYQNEPFDITTNARFGGKIKLGTSYGNAGDYFKSNGPLNNPTWSKIQWSEIEGVPSASNSWVKMPISGITGNYGLGNGTTTTQPDGTTVLPLIFSAGTTRIGELNQYGQIYGFTRMGINIGFTNTQSSMFQPTGQNYQFILGGKAVFGFNSNMPDAQKTGTYFMDLNKSGSSDITKFRFTKYESAGLTNVPKWQLQHGANDDFSIQKLNTNQSIDTTNSIYINAGRFNFGRSTGLNNSKFTFGGSTTIQGALNLENYKTAGFLQTDGNGLVYVNTTLQSNVDAKAGLTANNIFAGTNNFLNTITIANNSSTSTYSKLFGSWSGTGNIATYTLNYETKFGGNTISRTPLSFDYNGWVGINGITSPTVALDVSGSIKSTSTISALSLNSSSTTLLASNSGNVGIGTTSPYAKLTIVGINGTTEIGLTELGVRNYSIRSGGLATGVFDIADLTAGASRFSIRENGNIGVGMSTPDRKLVIDGQIGFSYGDGGSYIGLGSTADKLGMQFFAGVTSSSTNNSYRFADNTGNNIFTIQNSGNIGIGTSVASEKVTVANNGAIGFTFDGLGHYNARIKPSWNTSVDSKLSLGVSATSTGVVVESFHIYANGTYRTNGLTTTEINALPTPIEGMTVWNSDLKTWCFYNGTIWKQVTSSNM